MAASLMADDIAPSHGAPPSLGKAKLQSDSPIGVFDSGLGGLTVAGEIMRRLPCESIVYFGDSARCPYGPRDAAEVQGFVRQICAWLVSRGVKLIVIACNTATAAGLALAQREFPVPVIGVVQPGARAAVRVTQNRRVGVIGTKSTIESGAYSQAIRSLDAGITVFSSAAPRFVEIAEQGLRLERGLAEEFWASVSKVYVRPAFLEIAREYLDPLKHCGIDTLVLGCTHYPMLKALIGAVVGRGVRLISSAEETACEVEEALGGKGLLSSSVAKHAFATTAPDVDEFRELGSRILKSGIDEVQHVSLDSLQAC